MNTTLIRLVAGPVAAASIIGGALGFAAVANASPATNTSPDIKGSVTSASTSGTSGLGSLHTQVDQKENVQSQIRSHEHGIVETDQNIHSNLKDELPG